MNKIKVGIVGGSGWTGAELLRLLLQHSQVELSIITSRSLVGQAITQLFPNLIGQTDLLFSNFDVENLSQCDIVFFATPHGVAMETSPKLLKKGVKVIDLGADFRLQDIEVWQQFYQMTHSQTHWVKKAVYGLPELNREAIKTAQLVANPGCYPTAVSLALAPLLSSHHIKYDDIIADCKSGVSGAGRGANQATSLCETSENLKAYGVGGHRHLPEINQVLSTMANSEVSINFIPHLIPMIRGMLTTVYVNLSQNLSKEQLFNLFQQHYQSEPFVQVLPLGQVPETRSVTGSNQCHIGIWVLANQKAVIITSIDNMLKGASSQAVQNMNLMFGLEERTGLRQLAMLP